MAYRLNQNPNLLEKPPLLPKASQNLLTPQEIRTSLTALSNIRDPFKGPIFSPRPSREPVGSKSIAASSERSNPVFKLPASREPVGRLLVPPAPQIQQNTPSSLLPNNHPPRDPVGHKTQQ